MATGVIDAIGQIRSDLGNAAAEDRVREIARERQTATGFWIRADDERGVRRYFAGKPREHDQTAAALHGGVARGDGDFAVVVMIMIVVMPGVRVWRRLVEAKEQKETRDQSGELAELQRTETTGRHRLDPLVLPALGERFIDDALLQKVEFRGPRLGLLLDGSQQQRVQGRMLVLDAPGDVAVVGLPAVRALPGDDGGNDEDREEVDQRAGGGPVVLPLEVKEESTRDREDSPAQGESAAHAPLTLPAGHRFQLRFQERFDHT